MTPHSSKGTTVPVHGRTLSLLLKGEGHNHSSQRRLSSWSQEGIRAQIHTRGPLIWVQVRGTQFHCKEGNSYLKGGITSPDLQAQTTDPTYKRGTQLWHTGWGYRCIELKGTIVTAPGSQEWGKQLQSEGGHNSESWGRTIAPAHRMKPQSQVHGIGP